jgi:hypothetical protein
MFTSDRDLLILEPNLFRDCGWTSQRLLVGTGTISGGVLTLSAMDNDFAAAAVGAGFVAVVDGTAYEILARLSATSAALSRPRPAAADPALPPTPAADKPVEVWTFRPQLALAHATILRMLGIDAADPVVPGRVTEDDITNPSSLRIAEALLALQLIYDATVSIIAPPTKAGWSHPIWSRAQIYRERFEQERQRAAARIDLDGDGLPDATRRLNVIQLRRA